LVIALEWILLRENRLTLDQCSLCVQDTLRASALLLVDLDILLEREEHGILPKGDFQVRLEVAEIVPSRHLVLGEGASTIPCGVFIVPTVITLAVGLP
jgi:hypothetical protein